MKNGSEHLLLQEVLFSDSSLYANIEYGPRCQGTYGFNMDPEQAEVWT